MRFGGGAVVWRAVCFKIIFVSCTISLSFSLNLSVVRTALSVVNIYSVGNVRTTVSVVTIYSVGLSVVKHQLTLSVVCTTLSVVSIYPVGQFYALLCRL